MRASAKTAILPPAARAPLEMSKPKKSLANWRGSQWQSPAKRSSGKAEPCIAGARQGHVARWHCRDLSRNGRARPSFAQAEQSPVWFGGGNVSLRYAPLGRGLVQHGAAMVTHRLSTVLSRSGEVMRGRAVAMRRTVKSSGGTVMHRPARARFGHPSARWVKVVRWHSPPLHCQSEHRQGPAQQHGGIVSQ